MKAALPTTKPNMTVRNGCPFVIALAILVLGAVARVANAQSGGPLGWTCYYLYDVRIHNVGTTTAAWLGFTELHADGTQRNAYAANTNLGPGQVYESGLIGYCSEGCYGNANGCPNPVLAVYAKWSTNTSQNPTLTTEPQGVGGISPCPGGTICLTNSTTSITFLDFYIIPEGGPQPQTPDDDSDGGDCHNDDTANADCQSCQDQGMPVWSVSQPYISLWLRDEPMGYQPAIGPRISLRLAYKQRDTTTGYNPSFSFGKKWNSSWLSYVTQDWNMNNVVHFPGGRQRTFYGNADNITHTTISGNKTNGFTLYYPDGSQDIFGYIGTNNLGVFEGAYMTKHVDPQGLSVRFNYLPHSTNAAAAFLQSIVDGDGNTTTISYVTNSGVMTPLISQVVDPFNRTVSFLYDSNGRLTNITDVAGISTSFVYDNNDWITNMTTPYGTTSFTITDTAATGTTSPANGRSVLVTEPDGGHHLFLYQDSAPGVPASYSAAAVPSTLTFPNTFDTNQLNFRNSFHWNKAQYVYLSTNNLSYLNSTDFRLAHMKHWLITGTNSLGEILSLDRQPSPDSQGLIEGQKTWYDYAGKTNRAYEGTESSPLFVARVLPDGTTRFTRTDRNSLGLPTIEASTYTSNNVVALRTTTFTYDANGIDLLRMTNASGVQVFANAYNTYHHITNTYNAVGEQTSFFYNANHQLSSRTLPTGLVTTNYYLTSGSSSNRLSSTIDYAVIGGTAVYYRTNSYTWANGLIATQTDPMSLTLTYTWDNLQRLRRVDYPDGTYITNFYTNLDLVRVIDRMGFTNTFGYDSVRRLIGATNANGAVTAYGYCTCGALQSVTNAFGSAVQASTTYAWDLQGHLLQTVGPDFYTVTRNYNALGQLTNFTDGLVSLTNWFNNQGLVLVSSNAYGQVSATVYDILDRGTNTVDANSVTMTNTFDNLNRLRSRGYPDKGVENWVYTLNIAGPTSYTNQVSNTVNYVYDPLGRKTSEKYPGVTTNSFTYDGPGHLLTLTDGKNQVTTWHYDIFGRTSNKVDATSMEIFRYAYDANDRLTSRLTPAKGTTTYQYDAVGNLTSIAYPVSSNISLAYDLLNRLTTMVDAVGTTHYTYNGADLLLTEDGPWADDTVNYTYNFQRLRIGLSLLAPNASSWVQAYGYDAAERLTNVTSPAGVFGYMLGGSAAASPLPKKLALPNGAYITNNYDSVARLLSTALKNSANTVLNSHAYRYNVAGQRTAMTNTAGDYRNYGYDNIGQLTSALGTEADGIAPRLHEQFRYSYDPAGNLNLRTNNELVQTFNVNTLNELTNVSRTTTNMTVAGTTTSLATSVTVSNLPANVYADATFARTNIGLVNGTNYFTAIATDSLGRRDTNSAICNLPSAITYAYDANGNLTNDGSRFFTYDDENQLISVVVTNNGSVSTRSDFVYDGKMRRRIRVEYAWGGTSWTTNQLVRYIYDGDLVIQERDGNNLPAVSYSRGTDLSGAIERAGGIGGLLARTDLHLTLAADPGAHCYYHSDANGNITALTSTNQNVAATYLYDPYGNILSQRGSAASANLLRFSSREFHPNSGLICFLYRCYDPALQRWLTPDQLVENGHRILRDSNSAVLTPVANRFLFVHNAPTLRFDPLGLDDDDGGFPKAIVELLKSLKTIYENMPDNPEKCIDPCTSATDLRAICDCIWGEIKEMKKHPENADTNMDAMGNCICLASGDTECWKKWKQKIKEIWSAPAKKDPKKDTSTKKGKQ